MSRFANAIGIDVSKNTLDAHNHQSKDHIQVTNDTKGFRHLIRWSKNQNSPLSSTLFCFEHTGLYSLPLAIFLSEQDLPYALVPGLEIKRSMGISRGKSDSADARTIARYAFLRRDEITLYQLPSRGLMELKNLLSLREKIVKQRAGYKASLKEIKYMKVADSNSLWLEIQQNLIEELTIQIRRIEKQIKTIIEEDETLNNTFRLVTSVKGVGLIVGATMIAYTNCFTSFRDWRKFACYCGIAPFSYQSGVSINGRKRVHPFANKRLKSLLSNAASVSIQCNPEMRDYYERRVNEGKSKMSTQNIIRNKIVSRVFAVVQRGTPYVDTYKFAA